MTIRADHSPASICWGILGVANINAAMVPGITATPGAVLGGIASRDGGRAQAAADTAGVRAFMGYHALLEDPTIDAVYIPTPNAHHAEWTLAALAAGKHVLCEKPLAVTVSEAQQMVEAATRADLQLAEAFMYAHHPRYDRVTQLVSAGAIGELRSIHVEFTFDASAELDHSGFQGAPGSGAIYDVGCYAVHVARMIFGVEPEAVTAHAQSSTLHGSIDMNTSLLLEFPGGLSMTATVGMWNADRDRVLVVGSHGWIEIPNAFLCPPPSTTSIVVTDASGSSPESFEPVDHYALQVSRFQRAIQGEQSLRFDPSDAISQARVLTAATTSWQQRERVRISAS